jgi:DNA ligase-1
VAATKETTLKAVKEAVKENVSDNAVAPPTPPVAATPDSTVAPGKISIPEDVRELISWEAGQSVPYKAVTDTFDKIEQLSGRLDKESAFRRLFAAVVATTPSDLDAVVYLASNAVSAAFEGVELGIGDSLLEKAIVEATGRAPKAVKQAYKEEGDLGNVAMSSKSAQKTLGFGAKPKPLTATFVLEQLRKIAHIKGASSQQLKVNCIKGMMVKAHGTECRYIIRSLQGKLRIGVAQQTVMVAIAHCFAQCPPSVVLKRIAADAAADPEVVDAVAEVDTTGMSDDDYVRATLVPAMNSVPAEAKTLREKWGHLKKEERSELAVIAVKRAFSECPSSSVLVKALLDAPLYDLYKACKLTPGIPVAPMLAKPTKEIGEVLKRLEGLEFTMEYKYDGERAQVHLRSDGTVKIFSRNSEDMSAKYPDLTEVMNKAKKAGLVVDCVLDAEVVAYDREENKLLSFQQLSTRKRKADDSEHAEEQKVKVALQGFDLLYLNGTSILPLTLKARRELLRKSFHEEKGMFYFASGQDHLENGDTAPIEVFMQEACAAMCEGLMVKTLSDNASYEPSKRSLNWLKLKKDYIDGMGVCDSVDLVVMGGYHGRGKRTNVYGAYLMGCYNPESDEYQSVCKVGTGFKDTDLTAFTEKMKDFIAGGGSGKRPTQYRAGDPLTPDDWFEPEVVWELQAADLSKSSVHMGALGKVDPNRGIGLRFPRFIRERDDKGPENATNAEQIADMYRSQGLDEGGTANMVDDDDDEDAL